MNNQLASNSPAKGRRRGRKIAVFIFIIILAAFIPIAYVGWQDLYSGFLEAEPPVIEVTEQPRGIGLLPVALRFKLTDLNSGLDEVVVRSRQRSGSRVILRQKLDGRKEANVEIEFPGQDSALEPGLALIQIRAFDRSLWNNTIEEAFKVSVDYRKPTVEVASTHHNVTVGGSQLVFYRAFDESLAISGVKVGQHTFLGIPARGIDKSFGDQSLFLALYTVDFDTKPEKGFVKVFAEDLAGNASSKTFFNRVKAASIRKVNKNLSEEFLRTRTARLFEINHKRLEKTAGEIGMDIALRSKRGTKARLIEQFQILNDYLRVVDNNTIVNRMDRPHLEAFFSEAFEPQAGSLTGLYGDHITYAFQGNIVGEHLQQGYVYRMRSGTNSVSAANDGIVIFSDDIGVYGRTVAIDHGLGVTTLYGSLGNIQVQQGQEIQAGDPIGSTGPSGIFGADELYFEVRLHGVPVNPREWFDRSWYYAHITSKAIRLKQKLGIPVYE